MSLRLFLLPLQKPRNGRPIGFHAKSQSTRTRVPRRLRIGHQQYIYLVLLTRNLAHKNASTQHSSREVILHLRLEENMRDMLPGNPPRAEIRLPVQRVGLQTAMIIAFSDDSLVFAS
jgi:hypothetical protein